MKGLVYKEIRAIKKVHGDLYQNFADRHSITKEEAKDFLTPFLYGVGLSKIKPTLTEGEAINLLNQFNKLYQKRAGKINTQTLKGESISSYIRKGNKLVKVA